MKQTLVINTIGEPSVGKTTAAHGLMYKLRCKGISAEFIPEVAKELVWGNDFTSLGCQQYILGEMLRRLERVNGKVDVIVTDGPLILAAYYNNRYAPNKYSAVSFEDLAISAFNSYKNLVLFFERDHPYEADGRNQDETESAIIRKDLRALLLKHHIDYIDLISTEKYLNLVVDNYLKGMYDA